MYYTEDVDTIPYGRCHCGCGGKTSIAKQTNRKVGCVKGNPVRFLVGHAQRKSTDRYTIQDRGYETPCWIWDNPSPGGYGTTRGEPAHRYFYKKFVGKILKDLVIHHRCEVTACVNPDHLEPVSISLNRYYAKDIRRAREDALMAKKAKAFRLSEAAVKRLEMLADKSELSQTAYLEQLLKREAEKNSLKVA